MQPGAMPFSKHCGTQTDTSTTRTGIRICARHAPARGTISRRSHLLLSSPNSLPGFPARLTDLTMAARNHPWLGCERDRHRAKISCRYFRISRAVPENPPAGQIFAASGCLRHLTLTCRRLLPYPVFKLAVHVGCRTAAASSRRVQSKTGPMSRFHR